MRARIVVVVLLAVGACGAPTDNATSPDTGPSTSGPTTDAFATTTVASSTTTSLLAEPERLLQLCDEVPVLTTTLTGTDPTGAAFDPIFDGVLLTYAQEHESAFGGMWLDRASGGTKVLAFTDDPVARRAELALRRPTPNDVHPIEPMPPTTDDRPIGEWGIAFDVVQVTYTETELIEGVGIVLDTALALGLPFNGAGVDTMRNRISLSPSLPLTWEEAVTVESAIKAVAPLEMVCLEGALVDSRPDPIAPGTPLDVIVLPDADGTYPPETDVQCAGLQFTLGDLQSMTPIEQADPDLRAVVDGWVNGPGGMGWPTSGWVVLVETEQIATMIHYQTGSISSIGAERGPSGWLWAGASGGGACDVARRLPPGLGGVSWSVDQEFPPPEATDAEVHLIAVESACTGGSVMGDRLLGPQVGETESDVRIVFAAIPLVGAQNCPGNPPTPVTVTLDRPLGDRTLIDGLVIGPLADLVPPSP